MNISITSKFDETGTVAFEQNLIVYKLLPPEAKLITNYEKINELSHFVQMLQTVPVSSNFEVIIMFTRQFANNPWVHDENLSYINISLL